MSSLGCGGIDAWKPTPLASGLRHLMKATNWKTLLTVVNFHMEKVMLVETCLACHKKQIHKQWLCFTIWCDLILNVGVLQKGAATVLPTLVRSGLIPNLFPAKGVCNLSNLPCQHGLLKTEVGSIAQNTSKPNGKQTNVNLNHHLTWNSSVTFKLVGLLWTSH